MFVVHLFHDDGDDGDGDDDDCDDDGDDDVGCDGDSTSGRVVPSNAQSGDEFDDFKD